MAIQSVKATVNGTEYTLTYNSSTGKYEKSITAPNITSFNQPSGYYPVTLVATNTAGTSTTVTATEESALRLVVKEKVKPTISNISPANGAYVVNNQTPITFKVTDETNGSGVKASSITLKLDGTTVSNLTKTAITNGYSCSYTPSSALSDGSHTIVINAQDNDGNSATQKTVTFTIDTIPPTLNVTAPQDGLITATSTVTVTGVTNDSTSSPVTVTIENNGTDAGTVTVNNDGSFSKSVTLTEGANTIVVTTTDRAGKVSTVTINVTLDTSVPTITNITVTPNPADAGATVVISAVITG